jgi:tetratricopeptide (TPR) repeat protein
VGFVGREPELDLLMREAIVAVETSSGRSLFVTGLPGAGKTELATHFLDRLAAERPEIRIARGRCLQSFGCADPYLPFVDALRDLSDEGTAGFVEKETVAELITELAPYWLQVVPMVGGLLAATLTTASALRGKPKADVAPSREALFVQYLDLVRKLAADAPLVLFLDDLHWADQSSIALLTHVTRGIAAQPVLVVGTLRSDEVVLERHPVADLIRELEREELARRLELGELEGASLEALLAAEFGGDVSEPLARWVIETAGGNPLFASELCRLLRQSESVVEEKGEWHLTGAAREIEVPRTAEAVVERRVERLEPESIRVLQYASIQGTEFDSTTLAQLLEEDELDVLDRLEKIERRHQLVRTTGELDLPDGDIATTLRFSHALLQTVLYRQVVGKRRLLLHRKCGEILETLHTKDTVAVANQLARHFHEGRVKDSAFRYAGLAADTARRVYAHWEAVEFLKIALQHSPGEAETVALEERLGDVYDTVGYYEKGMESFQAALGRLPGPGEVGIRLRRKVLRAERKLGVTPAPVLLQRTRALLEEAGDWPVERCHLLMDVTLLPDTADAMEAASEALRIAERQDDKLLLLAALERMAPAIVLSGRSTRDLLPHLERALQIIEELGDPLRAALTHQLTGIAHAKLGHFHDARGSFQKTLEMAEKIGNPRMVAGTSCNLGLLMIRLGRFQEAERYLLEADRIHERRDRAMRMETLLNLAEQARLTGVLELAIERYRQMAELAQEFEYWDAEAKAHAGQGLCLLAAGRLPEAQERAWSVMPSVADRERWFEDRDLVELFLARLEVADDKPQAALERLEQTAAMLRKLDVYLWARVELERVGILRESEPERAGEILAEVVTATQDIQSPPLEVQIEKLRAMLLESVLATAPGPAA